MTAGSLPYVSIVITGRNDGHGGDFVTRFLATLRFNHTELTNRGIPHEFVLVEWAPLPAMPLLSDLVDECCTPTVATAVHTIVVDAAYQAALTQNPRLRYHEYLAKNAGIRRARGEYVLTTNCDVFLGRHVLERLERRALEPEVVYRAARWDLASTIEVNGVDWNCLEDPVNLVQIGRPLRPPYYAGGAGDFIALDRAAFERVGGFNEVYRVARAGIDRNFLVHAVASGLRIVDIGGPVYHVDHDGSYRFTQQRGGRAGEAQYGIRWHANAIVYRNPPAWGLRDAPARPFGERRTYLDFSWDAVPPLVDLAGLVASPRVTVDPGGRGSARQ